MSTNYMISGNQFRKVLTIIFSALLTVNSFEVHSQDDHQHGSSCTDIRVIEHLTYVNQVIDGLINDREFLIRFDEKYNFNYLSFTDVNSYFILFFKREIGDRTISLNPIISENEIKIMFLDLIEQFKLKDELWFEIPAEHGKDVIYYGRHILSPNKQPANDGVPKTLDCFNAGFENQNWNGWETYCASATSGSQVANIQAYTPPAGCTSPSGSPTQHSFVTSGDDPIGGFPRVFQGGVSAMLGNGANANNPTRQAAVLRKTFVVDQNNALITYNYAAVMSAGDHNANTQPFFKVTLTIDGVNYYCAEYSATANDGQSGWIQTVSGNTTRWHKNWTTIAIPLMDYVGSTVELEFTVSDCNVDGGIHYAYAYIDVSCGNIEVEQFCDGSSTVLSAPDEGIVAYEWVPGGETTQQITITTPGEYSVWVLPYGSPCSALLTYDASLYPTPTADFSVNRTSICVGGDIDFTNLSTVEPGGTITSYQWNYGDGINIPASTGTISGVPQTSGTYEDTNNHLYNSLGNQTVILTVRTADGCTDTSQVVINVIPGPEAVINGSTTVCQGDPPPEVTFTGSLTTGPYIFTYNINGGSDQYVSTAVGSSSATIPVPTSTPGTYTYNLTYVVDTTFAMCEQAQFGTVSIIVRDLPKASISNPVEACHNDSVLPEIQFTGADGQTPYTFTYTVNGGSDQQVTSVGSTATIQVPANVVGTFVYRVTHIEEGSALGCNQSQSVSTVATIHALPTIYAGNDFSVCADAPVILTGAGGVTYIWDHGVINGVPFNSTDTTAYTVTGTDHNGCENTDQVTVNVVPIPVMNITGENLYGCQPVTPVFTNNSTGNLTNCTWYLGNGSVLQGCGVVSSTFDHPGCYDVTLVVSTPEGCTNTLTINDYVCVEPYPVADFHAVPNAFSTYESETTQMVNESTGADSYEWHFGDGSPPSYEVSPYHTFSNEVGGNYTVMLIASTNAGCVDTAYTVVRVKEELIFYIPNTFTPDGDNYNQTFRPVFTTGFDPYNYTLYIYNRWGELIFESHDATVGWDGTYGINGEMCQDGTYIWKIGVKKRMIDERLEFSGHVNLIR